MPPFVRIVGLSDVRVIRCPKEIEFPHIVRVPEMLHDAAVEPGAAIGHVRVPMKITPIQPIIFGSAATAVKISEALLNKGILVSAIRPPTVPQNTARLRISFSATHTEDHVDQLVESLVEVNKFNYPNIQQES